MARIEWDKTGERLYETGVDRVVLYTRAANGDYENGAPWNGVTAISETPSGGEPTALWADNTKYLNLMSTEEVGGSIEAYTYPEEFEACNGTAELVTGVRIGQQKRATFGLCYRTLIGNDVKGTDYGYKLHLVYGANASPSEASYSTVNDSPEAATLSWEYTTTPVNVEGHSPTATLSIDSTKVDAAKLKALEDILYGTESEAARLPLPSEVAQLIGEAA